MVFAIKRSTRETIEIELARQCSLNEELVSMLVDLVEKEVSGGQPRRLVIIAPDLKAVHDSATPLFDCPKLKKSIVGIDFITSCAKTSGLLNRAVTLMNTQPPKNILCSQGGCNSCPPAIESANEPDKFVGLSELNACLAHEITGPLSVIIGRSEIVLDTFETDALMNREQLTHNVERILQSARRISRIVKGMKELALHKPASESQYETSVASLFRETAELCTENLRLAGVHLEMETPPETPHARIRCNPVQVTQVLVNLINNAKDGIENLSEKWIRVSCALHAEKIVVTVTDSGAGIPASIRDKIMKPLFTTKGPERGTGLGLAICTRIVNAHGGVLYYNADSQNTEFVFELPLAKARRENNSPAA